MSVGPSSTRWSKDNQTFGKQIMRKSGWEEGKGLGKHEDGAVEHVKAFKKADNLGIGHEGQHQQTWSAQSVQFADILKRINAPNHTNNGTARDEAAAEDESNDTEGKKECTKPKEIVGGTHSGMYSRRSALKTEALRNQAGKAEVLGVHHRHGHHEEHQPKVKPHRSEGSASVPSSTLSSLILRRLMVREVAHEPKPSAAGDDEAHCIVVTMPEPKPPKASVSPFQ